MPKWQKRGSRCPTKRRSKLAMVENGWHPLCWLHAPNALCHAGSAAYKDFLKDLLAGFGPVSIRNMFSGAGVYADGVMFAILAEDTLYLKADEFPPVLSPMREKVPSP